MYVVSDDTLWDTRTVVSIDLTATTTSAKEVLSALRYRYVMQARMELQYQNFRGVSVLEFVSLFRRVSYNFIKATRKLLDKITLRFSYSDLLHHCTDVGA